MKSVPVRVTFRILLDGQLNDVQEKVVALAVQDELLTRAEGTLRWSTGITLDASTSQKGLEVLPPEEQFPLTLWMTPAELRALVVSEGEGTASMTVPLTMEVAKGREVVRGADGQAKAAIEKDIATIAWDRSQVAA